MKIKNHSHTPTLIPNTTKAMKNQEIKCVKEQKNLRRRRHTPSLRRVCSTYRP